MKLFYFGLATMVNLHNALWKAVMAATLIFSKRYSRDTEILKFKYTTPKIGTSSSSSSSSAEPCPNYVGSGT